MKHRDIGFTVYSEIREHGGTLRGRCIGCAQCYLETYKNSSYTTVAMGRVKDNNDDELDGHDEASNDGYAIRDDTFFHYLS